MCWVQIDYAYELIDEIHPIDKYPIYVAFPWLRYITSRCCYGIPFLKPYDPQSVSDSTVNDDESNDQQTALINRYTYTYCGREKKKRKKKQRKNHFNKEKTKDDPLTSLGFGIVAYTGILYYMIWAFLLYTVLLLPAFFFYHNGQGYDRVYD